jgi:hypothetical protein
MSLYTGSIGAKQAKLERKKKDEREWKKKEHKEKYKIELKDLIYNIAFSF